MRDIMTLIEGDGKFPKPFHPFYLPPSAIKFYDDPYSGAGDDGYTVADLKAEVEEDGEILYCIQVGKSRLEMPKGDHSIFAFNGNHRLAVAKELNLPEIICENASGMDDAYPLSIEEIVQLGGRLL
jgi:hypothetical protein